MRIGIYIANYHSFIGGGYVYQKCLYESIINNLADLEKHHDIIFFGKGENELLDYELAHCVDADWYEGKLNEAALRFEIDIIWFLSIAYEPVDVPYILPVWDLQHRLQPFFPEVSSGNQRVIRENTYNQYLPRATYILTGTAAGRDEIAYFYNITKDRIVINPLPLPKHIASHSAEINHEVQSLQGVRFIFYPAQFWPHKNHIVLLETLKLLKFKYHLDMKLVFTGSDHGNMSYIEQKVAEMGLENDVRMLGFVSTDSLCWLYQNAFTLVYPSYFGPDNIPPLEAFSAGCPVIAANVSGAEEQLGDAALLVNPSDEEAFANAIILLFSNQELMDTLILKGKELVKQRTADNYVYRVFDLFDTFSAIRRCWGGQATILYAPLLVEWVRAYLEKKEIFTLFSLLAVCTDQVMLEMRESCEQHLNTLMVANSRAKHAIEAGNYSDALGILNTIVSECVDLPEVYMNLADLYLYTSEFEKALECNRLSKKYADRIKKKQLQFVC